MKTSCILASALLMAALGTPMVSSGAPPETSQSEQKPKLMNLKGTVKSEGGKITFVADDTGKTWDVVNPETLKEHVGHHVEVSAHVYADKGAIHIMKVTML